jgi:ABC-type Fe3+ transport system substrate-binding protein
LVQASGQKNAALKFLEFLTSSEGRRILEAGGLFPP